MKKWDAYFPLGKTYGIKVRCYWEHPWGTHWEPDGNFVENLKGTCWEQTEIDKKGRPGGERVGGWRTGNEKQQAITYRKHKAGHHDAGSFTPGNMASESDKQNVPEFFFLNFFFTSVSLSWAIWHLHGSYIFIIFFMLLRFHSFPD
jgi:hypothetical protein